MNIRTINTDELNLLFQLFEYNDPDEMIAENTRDITEGKIDIFSLFQENRLIGELHAAYVHDDDRFAIKNKRAYLFAFRIHKDFQGKGYGQFLMNKVISILEENGYLEFTIGVEDDNGTAIHIYSKLGFKFNAISLVSLNTASSLNKESTLLSSSVLQCFSKFKFIIFFIIYIIQMFSKKKIIAFWTMKFFYKTFFANFFYNRGS